MSVDPVVVPIRQVQIKRQPKPAGVKPRPLASNTFAHVPADAIERLKPLNSCAAVMVLLYAAAQYRRPEKPIALPVVELSQQGYGSKSAIARAIGLLETAGLLVRTKHHGNGQCALFSLGWKQPRRGRGA